MAKTDSFIKLEEHVISDSVKKYSRRVRLLRRSSQQPSRLCIFLDGELYLEKMNVAPVLNDFIKRDALPPVTFAFIDHLDMKSREQDYTCNDGFGKFIVETVIPWLQQQVKDIQSGEYLIGGLSLSGLASTWLALQYPDFFRYCLAQSGSFWWNDQFLTKMAAQRGPVANRFWLSVGDLETEVDDPPEVSQIEGVRNAREALKSLGATVHYHEYHGGHDLNHWRAELKQALNWLFSERME